MAYERIDKRVELGFATSATQEFAPKYLDSLIINMRDLASATRRATLLLVLTIIAFFVISDAQATITLGPFKVDDPRPLVALLPAVTAHLLYEIISYLAAMSRYTSLTGKVVRHLHPTLYEHDLEMALYPATATLVHLSPWRAWRHHERERLERISEAVDIAGAVALLAAAAGFLVYAGYHLVTEAPGLPAWISVGFIVFCVARVSLVFLLESAEI